MLRKDFENEVVEKFPKLPEVDQKILLWFMRWRVWLDHYYELHWLTDTSRSLVHLGFMFLVAHLKRH